MSLLASICFGCIGKCYNNVMGPGLKKGHSWFTWRTNASPPETKATLLTVSWSAILETLRIPPRNLVCIYTTVTWPFDMPYLLKPTQYQSPWADSSIPSLPIGKAYTHIVSFGSCEAIRRYLHCRPPQWTPPSRPLVSITRLNILRFLSHSRTHFVHHTGRKSNPLLI